MPFGIPAEDFHGGFGLPDTREVDCHKKLFDESMSSEEAMAVLFNYGADHRGEDLAWVKKEYGDVISKIIPREMRENRGAMTSHHMWEDDKS